VVRSTSGVAFVPTEDPDGIRIDDRVSGRQYALRTPVRVAPSLVDAEVVPFPVDDAVSVETDAIRIADPYAVFVRQAEGDIVSLVDLGDEVRVPPGDHYVELTTPVKTYLGIREGFDCVVDPDADAEASVRLELDDPGRVVIAARPRRISPEYEVTVGDEPGDLLDALSYAGSVLQTLSPERSFPTLRGHPPAIRVGDGLDVPDGLSKADSGVRIEVPPTLPAAYAVAPLAFYLAAEVVPGDRFAVRTDDGFEYAPTTAGGGTGRAGTGDDAIADAAREALERCLVFDCLVRTEGYYPIDLQERRDFEAEMDEVDRDPGDEVDLDFAALYDASLAERTATALELPREPIATVAPRWPVAALVEPGPAATEALPYLLDQLAVVRTADPPRYSGDEARRHALRNFASPGDGPFRSASLVFDGQEAFVDLPDTDVDRTVWVGDGIPFDAAKFLRAGYEHRQRRADELTDATLRVDVVSSEAEMDEELEAAREAYAFREDRAVDTRFHGRLSSGQLRDLIESGTDFLHFIGHATPEGLTCFDGELDVATVDRSRVDAFCLNACESYRQGELLVERGSVGGFVTYREVADGIAAEVGPTIARLLDQGFPLGAARAVLRTTTNVGGQYAVVGDESVVLAQPAGGPPFVRDVTETAEGYRVRLPSFAASASRFGIGALKTYSVGPTGRQYLVSGTAGPFDLAEDEFREFDTQGNSPLLVDGDLRWDLPGSEPDD
jgi:hypothetical protein